MLQSLFPFTPCRVLRNKKLYAVFSQILFYVNHFNKTWQKHLVGWIEQDILVSLYKNNGGLMPSFLDCFNLINVMRY